MRLAAGLMIAGSSVALACLPGGPALAQAVAGASPAPPSVSQAVVQAVPGGKTMSLNAALSRLARNPRDGEALIDAGKAALAMGDVDAAIGFYTRADQVLPGNPRVKAGLAGALVRNENPFDAIPLFAEAERGGVVDADLAADRGLAYDLVGDNLTAQAHYRDALARGSDDEVLRRLALSYAMAGDKRSAEATLAPLLARQDKSAFRSRAFALAILGQPEDAVAIAYASLPAELAAAISPYLRYMPRLTPAQQAAAANFGHFPRASEIGRDDPRVAVYAAAHPRRGALASADAALIPKGEPLGSKSRRPAARSNRMVRADMQPVGRRIARAEPPPVAAPRDTRAAPPEVMPTRVVAEAAATPAPANPPAPRRNAAAGTAKREGSPQVARTTVPTASAGLMQPPATTGVKVAEAPPLELPPVPSGASSAVFRAPEQPSSVPAPSTPAPAARETAPAAAAPRAETVQPVAPGFDLAGITGSAAQATPTAPPAAALAPQPTAAPAESAPPVQKPRSLAEAFSDLAPTAIDPTPASGAVDIRRIAPPREQAVRQDSVKKDAASPAKASKPERPAPPSHPSRIWVQIATGRDKNALAFDWRRMARQAPEAFRGKSANVSTWGQTNRLLAGPFPTQAAANAFLGQLAKADIDGSFVWTSPAGQVVDALGGR